MTPHGEGKAAAQAFVRLREAGGSEGPWVLPKAFERPSRFWNGIRMKTVLWEGRSRTGERTAGHQLGRGGTREETSFGKQRREEA